jgi:hypothetical protein
MRVTGIVSEAERMGNRQREFISLGRSVHIESAIVVRAIYDGNRDLPLARKMRSSTLKKTPNQDMVGISPVARLATADIRELEND